MNKGEFVFTSESVGEGHPDKVADQISDAVLDECLSHDARSRVACETLVKNGVVILAGEITCSKDGLNYENLVRQVLRDIGYDDPDLGFDSETVALMTHLTQQSQDISMGVNENEGTYKEQGAGDQGIMFGYACNDTPEYMPIAISLAHKLMHEASKIRHAKEVDFLRPDAKSQVSVRFKNGKPHSIDTVVLSTQHTEDVSLKDLEAFVVDRIIKKVIPDNLLTDNTRYLVNPTGRFVTGGPLADCGLTGRKIIVDTYGGWSRHGGGAFSGKDPSKVDRSAAYAARYIAKNIVAAGLAEKCEVQLAYAIGVAAPVAVYLDTFDTGKVDETKLSKAVMEVFDLRPRAIIENLNLLKPIYRPTAAHGHFGREATKEGHFSWERTDKAEALKNRF